MGRSFFWGLLSSDSDEKEAAARVKAEREEEVRRFMDAYIRRHTSGLFVADVQRFDRLYGGATDAVEMGTDGRCIVKPRR